MQLNEQQKSNIDGYIPKRILIQINHIKFMLPIIYLHRPSLHGIIVKLLVINSSLTPNEMFDPKSTCLDYDRANSFVSSLSRWHVVVTVARPHSLVRLTATKSMLFVRVDFCCCCCCCCCVQADTHSGLFCYFSCSLNWPWQTVIYGIPRITVNAVGHYFSEMRMNSLLLWCIEGQSD